MKTVLLCALMVGFPTACVGPGHHTALTLRGPANPTAAGATYCGERPEECGFDPREPTRIVWTPRLMATLQRINTRVNHAIVYQTDIAHWGVTDRWGYAEDGRGDCEDFALVKRRDLVRGGLPKRVLRLAVVRTAWGEGHMVLIVRTTRGDLVLDSAEPTSLVQPWWETPYRFETIEGDGRPDGRRPDWRGLGSIRSPAFPIPADRGQAESQG